MRTNQGTNDRTDELHGTIGSGFSTRYRELAQQVRVLAGSLTEEQFWQKPFSFGNSFGHLVLHLTGNLNYYIGAQIAKTGYTRDRDREFSESERPLKAEVLRKFDQAMDIVLEALQAQSAAKWSLPYSAVREEDAGNRFNIFLRCVTHLHHHVGQMMYLCAQFREQQSTAAIGSR